MFEDYSENGKALLARAIDFAMRTSGNQPVELYDPTPVAGYPMPLGPNYPAPLEPPIRLFPALELLTGENIEWAGGTIRLEIIQNEGLTDRLIYDGNNLPPLTAIEIALNAQATTASVRATIREFRYRNLDADSYEEWTIHPIRVLPPRQIRLTLRDGAGNEDSLTKTVEFPILTNVILAPEFTSLRYPDTTAYVYLKSVYSDGSRLPVLSSFEFDLEHSSFIVVTPRANNSSELHFIASIPVNVPGSLTAGSFSVSALGFRSEATVSVLPREETIWFGLTLEETFLLMFVRLITPEPERGAPEVGAQGNGTPKLCEGIGTVIVDVDTNAVRTLNSEIPIFLGGGAVVISNFTGSVTVTAHPIPNDSNRCFLTIDAGSFTAPSFALPSGIHTGPNALVFGPSEQSYGLLELSSGSYTLAAPATIFNDLFPEGIPVQGSYSGVFDCETGRATVQSSSTDLFRKTDELKTIRHVNEVWLTWTSDGVLENATDLLGPWTALPNAASPFQVETTTANQQFFRLRLEAP